MPLSVQHIIIENRLSCSITYNMYPKLIEKVKKSKCSKISGKKFQTFEIILVNIHYMGYYYAIGQKHQCC